MGRSSDLPFSFQPSEDRGTLENRNRMSHAAAPKPDPAMDSSELLRAACDIAERFLAEVGERPVGRPVDFQALLARMRVPLTAQGEDPLAVLRALAESADPGLVATVGPRYFGFVVGGAHPASVAAEWLAAAWDQNAFSYLLSPAAAAAEEVCREWLVDLLGLPSSMSAGFTTGATMANFTGLAAARHALLKKVGWDVETRGLFSAPEIPVLTSAESHIAVFGSLQMLGLGRDRVTRIATDDQGRMCAYELRRAIGGLSAPPIVCAQAGNVDTGSFDPLSEISDLVHDHGGWLHIDGAFGAWAAASPALRPLAHGIDQADSLAIDCHKWLNVPQDSGIVFVRDEQAHRAAMTWTAPYFMIGSQTARDNYMYVPDASRRARGFAIYAALRALGRNGLVSMIERCCQLAQRMAAQLSAHPQIAILNDVVLNQVLVRFSAPGQDTDAFTRAVIAAVQQDGTCWAGGTKWHSQQAMRIAVSNWSTTESDIDRSADAILHCVEQQV